LTIEINVLYNSIGVIFERTITVANFTLPLEPIPDLYNQNGMFWLIFVILKHQDSKAHTNKEYWDAINAIPNIDTGAQDIFLTTMEYYKEDFKPEGPETNEDFVEFFEALIDSYESNYDITTDKDIQHMTAVGIIEF
jgi:hypothetical protein